jgi:hypothetical protein
MMDINSNHVAGFAVGVGAAALGFYLYKQNQERIDHWLRQQGIQLPQGGAKADSEASLQDLIREKERLEDLIAEREAQAAEQAAAQPA